MMKRKGSTRLFCTLLTVILLFSTLAFPTTAVTLDESALPELPLPSTEAEEATEPEAEMIAHNSQGD